MQGYQFEYPLVLDIEDSTQTKLSKEQVSAIIQAFCDTMESKGYYISLYSYASFLNSYVYQSVLEDYDIWVAHFGVSRPVLLQDQLRHVAVFQHWFCQRHQRQCGSGLQL